MDYYSTIKKEWNHAICSNMVGPMDCHTKWSKSERKGQLQYVSLIYGIKNKRWGKLFTEQKQTHRCGEQMVLLRGKYLGKIEIGSLGQQKQTIINSMDREKGPTA